MSVLKCALQIVQFDLAWWWRRLINDLRGSYFSNKVPYLWSSIPCTPQGKHVFSSVPDSSPTKKRRYQFHHKVVTFCHTIVRIWKDLVSSAIECKLILVGRWLISMKPNPALTQLLCKKNKMRITMYDCCWIWFWKSKGQANLSDSGFRKSPLMGAFFG